MEDIKQVALQSWREHCAEDITTGVGVHKVSERTNYQYRNGYLAGYQTALAELQKDAEPYAWVSPGRYGNNLSFVKPEPPPSWSDFADEWYCHPLFTSPAPKATLPEGWKLIAVNPAFDDLMYWMGRCEDKGHLENCSDLIEPWAQFEYRVIEAAPSLPAAQSAADANKGKENE